MAYRGVKRVLDILLTVLSAPFILPLMLILTLLIRLDSKGPVFFRQKRIGRHKCHFEIYKFRTMRVDTPRDVPTHLLGDPESCITPVGRFLRKTSLDELPQVINILKGGMSFVGPRPALWNQFDLIALRDEYNANDIRPGLTGLAQISGRDELPLDEKAALDGRYVEKLGLWMDITVFFKTFWSVFRQKGVKEGKS